ncbi:FAD-binding oxidoreductase [Acidisoma cellulosilytica]|uniref:FAD-binding oxidoreductase n=1 Tax=Acidisoma cellulosilyticum TaxID=2802395 RepID=A0A964E2V9_9PROT|nr:FAD-binding oxidoreductase [Acidisoma cellulosilyticum]MCB8879213.1 FAD-binding oxidoreductase [Acidisoma cellulosilyticum]
MTSLLDDLRVALGDSAVLTDPGETAGYSSDWRRLYSGRPLAVIRPRDTAGVAAAVKLCAEAGVSIIPQGGNTSMVGGAVPSDDGSEIVLSLERMRALREIDTVDLTMTVEAGVTLAAAQAMAVEAGMLLPLSISSEGSAQIGGVLATNAGGNNTLRFGNARDLVLGLEVVLADGQIWQGLRHLHKDNTGYALRQIFVGSEGTLGIITAAVLRLQPGVTARATAFCALPSVEQALALLARLRARDAGALHAFEYMSGGSVDLVLAEIEGTACPVDPAPHFILVDCATSGPQAAAASLADMLEGVLGEALEAGELTDAALAQNDAQRLAFWKIREEHAEAQKRAGASIKNDISVPLAALPDLMQAATAACQALVPGIRIAPFGHLGDGNIHFNLVQPEGADGAGFLAQSDALMDAVADVVQRLSGSFSAEHGVGRLKTGMMKSWRGGVELGLMQRIKAALDPASLLNPRVIFPAEQAED